MKLESNQKYYLETIEKSSFPLNCEETDFKKCTFRDVDFTGCDLSSIYFEECEFYNCDFSNSKFSKYTLKKDKFSNCKLVGINLNESTLTDVLFEDSVLRYGDFSMTTMNRVKFLRCDLTESSFFEMKSWKSLIMDECILKSVDFSYTSLKGLDLRTCDIEGSRMNPDKIEGLIVTHDQAMLLISLLRVQVLEIGEEIPKSPLA